MSYVLAFIANGVVVVLAGTALARHADAIADATKLGRLWIGSVLLAGATSLPELTTDISAVRMGATDLAVGDLFGSSMANMLILAFIDLLPPRKQEDLRRAKVEPFAWVVNRSLSAAGACDPLLAAKLQGERRQLERIAGGLAKRVFVVPWLSAPPVGVDALQRPRGREVPTVLNEATETPYADGIAEATDPTVGDVRSSMANLLILAVYRHSAGGS